MFEAIKDFKEYVVSYYGETKQGFKNILFFFNVVWNFRDWDYSYNLNLFIKTLELTLESIKNSYEVEEDKNKKIKDIERVIELINNITTDNYLERVSKKYDKNFSDLINVEYETPDEQGLIKMNFIYPEGEDIVDKIQKETQELENSENEELFELLKNNLKTWWV
jgi:hypothetical protein